MALQQQRNAMKLSHIQTPRNLSDCQFDVGYPLIPRQREYTLADVLYFILLIAIFAGMGVMLAWRG
jgi:hypothetical protein